MRKFIFYALVIVTLFNSCSRGNNNDGDYYFRFKVNGVERSFTGFVVEHHGVPVAPYVEHEIIGGNSQATLNDNNMGFYWNNDPGLGSLTTGVYHDLGTTYTLLAAYYINGISYEAGQSMAENAATHSITINHFSVNITSMSSSTMRGTFSGDFFQDGDVVSGTKLTITEGEFYVKRL
jgi:hypothetical protein